MIYPPASADEHGTAGNVKVPLGLWGNQNVSSDIVQARHALTHEQKANSFNSFKNVDFCGRSWLFVFFVEIL